VEPTSVGAALAHASVGSLPDHDVLILLAPPVLVLLLATIVVATWLQRRGLLGDATRTVELRVPIAFVCGGLSLAAAAIHFSVIESHLEEEPLFGFFFLVVGACQAIWAQVYVISPTRLVAIAGAAGNALVVLTWIVSRTTGLPFGPTPWIAEPVGLLDVLATVIEIVLIGLLLPVALRAGATLRRRLPVLDAVIAAGFSVTTVGVLTALSLVASALGLPADLD
jgi:hypothetical protein